MWLLCINTSPLIICLQTFFFPNSSPASLSVHDEPAVGMNKGCTAKETIGYLGFMFHLLGNFENLWTWQKHKRIVNMCLCIKGGTLFLGHKARHWGKSNKQNGEHASVYSQRSHRRDSEANEDQRTLDHVHHPQRNPRSCFRNGDGGGDDDEYLLVSVPRYSVICQGAVMPKGALLWLVTERWGKRRSSHTCNVQHRGHCSATNGAGCLRARLCISIWDAGFTRSYRLQPSVWATIMCWFYSYKCCLNIYNIA